MVHFHLSDSWEAKHQPWQVTWLCVLEQSDLSELWHSLGPFKMSVCCPWVISHQKETIWKLGCQHIVSWKSIQGVNKPSLLCEVSLGCVICHLFQAMQRYMLCIDPGYAVDMWMRLLSQQSWLIFWIPRKSVNNNNKKRLSALHTEHFLSPLFLTNSSEELETHSFLRLSILYCMQAKTSSSYTISNLKNIRWDTSPECLAQGHRACRSQDQQRSLLSGIKMQCLSYVTGLHQ